MKCGVCVGFVIPKKICTNLLQHKCCRFFLGLIKNLRNLRGRQFHSKKFLIKIKIVKLIEKYSGFFWKRQYIPIYLVNMTKRPSIADPLTLKFNKDVDSMMILVIHELIHLNLPEKLQEEAGSKVCEQWVNLITRFVSLDLKLDISKASMKNFSEALELGWNLNNKTLKEFILV